MTSSRLSNHGDTVDLVLDGFGQFGQVDRETDPRQADRQTVLTNLLSGRYERPLSIVASKTAEGWTCDVAAEIAQRFWPAQIRNCPPRCETLWSGPDERIPRQVIALRYLYPQVDGA
jgi:hypothetical protein